MVTNFANERDYNKMEQNYFTRLIAFIKKRLETTGWPQIKRERDREKEREINHKSLFKLKIVC